MAPVFEKALSRRIIIHGHKLIGQINPERNQPLSFPVRKTYIWQRRNGNLSPGESGKIKHTGTAS
jgi:hypothetical protein